MDIIFFLLPLDNPLALYTLFFGLIYISAFGFPMPEEIVLLLAGYLAYLGFTDFWITVAVLSASIIIADLSGYLLGRYAGDFLYEKIFGRFELTRELLEKGKKYIDRFGEKVVLLTRPISGVRFMVPILMGHFRMNIKKFVSYNLMAAILYSLILISLSYYLGSIFTLISDIDVIKRVVGWIIAGLLAIWIILRYIKKRRLRMRMAEK